MPPLLRAMSPGISLPGAWLVLAPPVKYDSVGRKRRDFSNLPTNRPRARLQGHRVAGTMRPMRKLRDILLPVVLVLAAIAGLTGCAAQEPPRYQVLRLSGSAKDRGYAHGQQMSSLIKSFYTTLLSTSLLPYLNRNQPDIASYLHNYDPVLHPEYGADQFSLMLLRESAASLEKSIPQEYIDEMHGIADGSGMDYKDILVLNTFVDTVLAARGITYFLQQAGAPRVTAVEWLGASLATDGVDNNGDGTTDEAGESLVGFYESLPHAMWVEVPPAAKIRVRLHDDDAMVDPLSVRVLVDGDVYTQDSPELVFATPTDAGGLPLIHDTDLTLTPKAPWTQPVVTIQVQAGDNKLSTVPPPSHEHRMRTEQFTVSTKGYGQPPHLVANRGISDGTSQPPSVAFAVRKSATPDGQVRLAHHFSLLDAGTSHKHTVVQIHHPTIGPSYVFVGWVGIAYGFAGMNSEGVAYGCNHSDTLNNPLVDGVLSSVLAEGITDGLAHAKLVSSGEPVGFILRDVLANAHSADEAAALAMKPLPTFGWNYLFADKAGGLRTVETRRDTMVDTPGDGQASWTPDATDPAGVDAWNVPWSSVKADDLRMGAHFWRLANDLRLPLGNLFNIVPQRDWSSYYFSSVRAMANLGEQISAHYGAMDLATMIAILRDPVLVDQHDSMTAVVIEPGLGKFHAALGTVPATDSDFDTFDLMSTP